MANYFTLNVNYADRDYQIAYGSTTTKNELVLAENHIKRRVERTDQMSHPEERDPVCLMHNHAINALDVARYITAETLDDVFRIGNIGPEDGEYCAINNNVAVPSLSVGHLILRVDSTASGHVEGELYVVMPFGFARVRTPNLQAVMDNIMTKSIHADWQSVGQASEPEVVSSSARLVAPF